jgi:hypothetical protein
MIDVDEIYRVPLTKINQTSAKVINSLSANIENVKLSENNDSSPNETVSSRKLELEMNRLDEKNVGLNLNLYKSGKFNLFQRHANQILIRGDNVVFIVLAE